MSEIVYKEDMSELEKERFYFKYVVRPNIEKWSNPQQTPNDYEQ